MVRCLLALVLLVASVPGARGQETAGQAIVGVVVDARTGQPLDGVLVEVTNPPQATTTDAEGRFRFEGLQPGRYELLASFVGYAFTKREVDVAAGENDVRVALSEGTAAYDESVIVRGDVFGVRESGVAGQQSLGSAELRQLGGMTLDDPLRAVQALAGVTASDDFYSELAVRGNGFSRLNYTLDGFPAGFLMHSIELIEDGGSITMINSDVLDHVSLLRGAYPQKFGRRLGSELDFASRDGSRQRPRYNLTASGTSAALTAERPLGAGRGSWLVSGRRSYLDVFLKQVLHDSSVAFGFSDIFSKVTYDLSEHHQVQATLLAGRSRLDRSTENEPLGLGKAAHTGWMGLAAWRHTISPRAMLTHRLSVAGESYRNDRGDGITAGQGHARDAGYRLDGAFTTAGGQLVETGVSVDRENQRQLHDFSVPGWRILGGEDFDRSTTSAGAYGQIHWTRGTVTITPGARVDRFGLTYDWVASPWLEVEWQARGGLTFTTGAGVHHQFPEIAQVVGHRGNGALAAERAVDVDAGVEGRIGAAMRWQVTGYNREERGFIDLPGQYFQVVNGLLRAPSSSSLFDNRLDGASRGIEIMLQRRSPDALSGWIAYSFGRTRYTDRVTGDTFDGDFDQRHTVAVFGRYRVSDRTSVNARWRFGSNRPILGYLASPAEGIYVVGASRNRLRVPEYSRLDVRADRTYTWGARRFTLFGEIINVLDHENMRQVPPGIDRFGRVFEPLNPMFPIVPSVGVTLEF